MPLFSPETRLRWKILGKKFGSRFFRKSIDVKASWADTPASMDSMVDFLNWFDTTTSIPDCLEKAARDWQYRFQASPHYRDIPKGAAMEIGFGGGRLLLQAARDFSQVFGVDIHNAFHRSEEFLHSQGVKNFRLVHRNEIDSIPAGSLDFVYSFIVFQHFDSLDEVHYYLDAIHRLLKKGGYAHIYFGKNPGRGVTVSKPEDFQLRDCSLFIEPSMMRELIAKRFEVLDFRDKLPRDPQTGLGESVQSSVIFRK